MSGPVVCIELAGPVADDVQARFGELLRGLSSYVESPRRHGFNVGVEPARLSITVAEDALENSGGDRPFSVAVCGPGFDETEDIDAILDEGPDLVPLIGYRPTREVQVSAGCNRPVDHLTAALLTAALMEIVDGLAAFEVYPEQIDSVRDLPGVIAVVPEPWGATVYGTAGFVRAWAAHPDFRIVK